MIHSMLHRFHNPDFGILFIRVALGATFMHAGWLKLADMEMVVGGFVYMGFPAYLAYFVAYAELIGGICYILGIFSRYFGIITAVIMAVAIFKVHFVNGFGLANGGYEYTLVLLLASLAMVTFGSGKYSLAGFIRSSR